MNHDDEKVLKELYFEMDLDQPPADLDQIILAQASSNKKPSRHFKSWLAAASMVLVFPLVWLITQQVDTYHDDPVSKDQNFDPSPVVPQAEKTHQSTTTYQHSIPQGTDAEERSEPVAMSAPAAILPPQSKDSQNSDNRLQDTSDSFAANKQLLLDELSAGKRKPSEKNLTPQMILKIEQLNQLIENKHWAEAQSLLDELQSSHPEYDFSEYQNLLWGQKPQ